MGWATAFTSVNEQLKALGSGLGTDRGRCEWGGRRVPGDHGWRVPLRLPGVGRMVARDLVKEAYATLRRASLAQGQGRQCLRPWRP